MDKEKEAEEEEEIEKEGEILEAPCKLMTPCNPKFKPILNTMKSKIKIRRTDGTCIFVILFYKVLIS